MSDATTKRMIEAYLSIAPATMFFTGLFQSPLSNFHNQEKVELDIQREDEDIAVVIQDVSAGYRHNIANIFTNKELAPPVMKEAITLNSFELLKRMPGKNPFEDVNFRLAITEHMFKRMVQIEKKIRRSIELQAAQILTTGTVTLKDMDGNNLFTVNYSPKTTHFPTVSNAWSGASGTPFSDIVSLANVIRNDGLEDPDEIYFGEGAFESFIKNDEVLSRLDNRGIDMGGVRPQTRGQGATWMGRARIGGYDYQLYTYNGRYKDPQTGVKTKYLPDDKVVIRASTGRLDATFGSIPNIGRELGMQRAIIPEMPGRFINTNGGMDLFSNVWVSPDGDTLFGGIGTRPLLIPTAIDTFGCLDVEP